MRTVDLDQITLCADGSIGLRFLKQVVEGDEVLMSEPHRTVIDPLGDVATQIAAVDEHLKVMGYPGAPVDAVERIDALKVVHRDHPEVAGRVQAIAKARVAEAKARKQTDAVAQAEDDRIQSRLARHVEARAVALQKHKKPK